MQTGPTPIINVKAGNTFSITLASNPTTGYKWELTNLLDTRYVRLLSSTYVPPANQARIGQGGQQVWNFIALRRGKTTITLKYCRPWDESDCGNFKMYIVSIG